MNANVALIVGAGPGLGGALGRRFARAGMTVVLSSRDGAAVEALAATVNADLDGKCGATWGWPADARDEGAVADLFKRVEAELGPVGVAVYNAGAMHRAGILDTEAERYEAVWRLCAYAGFLVGREAARRMADRQEGTILFTGATASMRGGNGFAAFAGGKFALRALAQSMARELGPRGVHVAHVVIDGIIRSERARQRFPDLPAERMLDPDAIAEAYFQLHAQDRSAWTFELDIRPATEAF